MCVVAPFQDEGSMDSGPGTSDATAANRINWDVPPKGTRYGAGWRG
jgi:hypothetical protein